MMENSGILQARAIKNKSLIFDRLIEGVQEAISKNSEVHYISDLELFGTNMTYKLTKEYWVYTLDKARMFFDSLEDYAKCKICRDLIISISKVSEHD